MIKRIMKEYALYSKNPFNDLENIYFIKESGVEEAVAYASTEYIKVPYSGFHNADANILSHELAHYYFYSLFKDMNEYRKDYNNFVHFAYNDKSFDYLHKIYYKYRSKMEWLKGIRPMEFEILIVDINKIMRDADKIREMVKTGSAIQGVNPYWQ